MAWGVTLLARATLRRVRADQPPSARSGMARLVAMSAFATLPPENIGPERGM